MGVFYNTKKKHPKHQSMNKNKNTQNNLIEAEQKIILQQKLTKDKKLQQEQTETKNLQHQLTKKIKTYSTS